MKRFLTLVLAIIYLGASTGTMLHMHYCMGKLANNNLDTKETNTCSNCGMKKVKNSKKGCCRDEQKFVKSSTDQKIAESSFNLEKVFSASIPVEYTQIPSISINSVTEDSPVSHAPPLILGVPIYIFNCIYRI